MKTKKEKKDLNYYLENIEVRGPGQWHNQFGPKNWYAVTNEAGIIAYFSHEVNALRFRLDYINSKLNP